MDLHLFPARRRYPMAAKRACSRRENHKALSSSLVEEVSGSGVLFAFPAHVEIVKSGTKIWSNFFV